MFFTNKISCIGNMDAIDELTISHNVQERE